ncbi:thiamine phosphate synthase [Methylophaga sp. OBS4]|uniref:thiamine phosphate synthase n=1 Tax=Methylophaga sp. OBS4 TaxID=2991935 RepID=UPI0022547972|nr:thiamine phosphate synthase [Methylophaga sp. OBS4]MCX4188064.1 thiamine phosphate synthase [Methylophaga sp. OBS4]
MVKPAVLLIGGLDPQGCAGITADIEAVNHHNCHALPLITAMTQQTSTGLTEMGAVHPTQFMAQYQNCVVDFDIKAIKIGLVPNLEIARCIKQILQQHDVPVVMDPVLASSSGGERVSGSVQAFVCLDLLEHITLLTPNLPELNLLTGVAGSLQQAAAQLEQLGLNACLVKGGHADSNYASDYFVSRQAAFYCYQRKFDAQVRGTGCVLAAAIASHLACGQDLRDAVVLAKAYVSRGIRNAQKAGPYRVIDHSREALELRDLPKLCYQAELIGQSFQFPSCPQRLGIYPVVDSSDWVQKLVDLDITTIQLRIKDQPADKIEAEISETVNYLKDKQVSFFVNDHWQQAIEHQAYGVHLGQEDLHDANLQAIAEAGLRLGVSTHSYWELARALAVNPSYIALGPIFETTSKQMPFSPQGIDRLHQWVRLLDSHYPLVAIGGIDLERVEQLKDTGVGSVAMITAITRANDYQQAIRSLLACWR